MADGGVREDTLVLLLHFTAAVKPSSAATDRIPDDLPVQIYVEDLTRQFDESQGPSCNVIDSYE